DASADVGAALSPVCRMVSRDVSADGWLSPARAMSIEDRVPSGSVTIPEQVAAGTLDACAVVDSAARSAGYYATPPPGAATRASWPLIGSLASDVKGVGPVAVESGSPAFVTGGDGSAVLSGGTV